MPTLVPSVAVGDYDTQTRQNLVATAIGEIQTELSFPSYRASVAGSKALANTTLAGWTWASAGGYTAGAGGLKVPSTGAYAVSVMLYYSAAHFNWTRMFVDIYYNSLTFPTNFVARNTAQQGNVENVVCVTGITPVLTGGTDYIIPAAYQDSGGTITFNTITLCISPVPYLV
jgi:hypothetical protein